MPTPIGTPKIKRKPQRCPVCDRIFVLLEQDPIDQVVCNTCRFGMKPLNENRG